MEWMVHLDYMMKLTIFTARPLPTWFAHTGEGGMAILTTLGALLVAWKRRALVTDLWQTEDSLDVNKNFYKSTSQLKQNCMRFKCQLSYIKRPLPVTQVRRSDGIPESVFWLLIPTRCEPRHTATKSGLCQHRMIAKAKYQKMFWNTNTYQHI